MIVLGLDLETTGLDKVKDRPIEVGLTLWTTNHSRGLESRSFLVQSEGVLITKEITDITHINQAMVDRFGYTSQDAYDIVDDFVSQVDAIVAFNGRQFDIPMMRAWAKRLGKEFPEKLIIDLYDGDLPGVRGQELITMCAKHGIYYDPHEAGADVNAMLRLMAKYPIDSIIERAKSPVIIVQSMQNRNENEKVKKHKFRWNPDRKIWWKKVKEIDLDLLSKEINNEFGLVIRHDLTPDMLENNEN